MLDLAAPALGELTGGRRTVLTGGAWVDHLPGWVGGSDEVFDVLLSEVPWRAERREMYDAEVAVPRLLCWYGGSARLPHPVLAQARDLLSRHYRDELGEPFVTAGMCLYRDGRDSVAWHGDTHGRGSRQDTMVAIVSFGSPRVLALRPRVRDGGDGGDGDATDRPGRESLRFALGHGDLVVMGGSCQRTWEHAVPKTARPVGPRVSVQFRPAGVA
ncbi:MAG: alpha-ketoglutarate-dependent dioxygenase AlkB [Kineosporiaceae bacterium]